MNQIYWTEQEFDALAEALRTQNPERAATQAATPQQFVFNVHEVGVAMRATFPRERWRALSKGMSYKLAARLIAACGGDPGLVRQRAAPNSHVRWTSAEWGALAHALLTLYPQWDLVNSPDLAQVRLTHLNKACQLMPAGRQRVFNALTGPIAQLLGVFADLRRHGDPLPSGVRPAADKPGAAPLPAVLKLAAVATPAAAAAPVSCKVFWSNAEWIKIAAELHRQYPHAKYPERNQLGALKPADVFAAQCVLPEERRRKNLKLVAMSQMRAKLLDGFRAVRQMQVEQSQQKVAEAQQEHHALLARAAAAAAVPNPWEVAFKPFVAMLVQQLRAELLPDLIAALQQALPAQAVRPTPPAQLSLAPAPARKSTMRIGIVGNRGTYIDDLERQFPGIEFSFIESTKTIASVRNCDKVIVLIKHISHKLAGGVQRAVGERYVPVNGGLSDMIRVIGGWLVDSAKEVKVAAA